VSDEIVEKRVKRTGDGKHSTWGWGDMDQDQQEVKLAKITHKKDE
jgi:stearoyl-CoA desaturase (Delta-9 desaturase)